MRKILILFLLTFGLILGGNAPVQAQSCYETCIANGNTAGECNAACTGTFIPPDPAFEPLEGPTAATFDSLNPLKIFGTTSVSEQLSTPGGVVTRVLLFAFPLAGLILFIMLVWGGAEILLGAASKKMVDAGKQRLTAALTGFTLLFTSYWIMQIIEVIFGITVL